MEMNEDVSRAGGKGDLPPLWQSQLIATVKKNMELRTSLLSMLLYIIPFVILTGILIIFTVFSATSDVNFWDPYNGTMGGIVILYFIMSLASLNAMGNEKEVGVRDLMLQSGLPRWIHILSWFVVDGLVAFITSFILAIVSLPGLFFDITSTSFVVPWLYFFLVLIANTPMNLLCIEIMPKTKLQPLIAYIIMWGPSYTSLSAKVFVAFYQDKDLFINPGKYGLRLNHFYSTVNPSDVTTDPYEATYTTVQSIGGLFAFELLGCFIFLFIAVCLQILISDGVSAFKWGTKTDEGTDPSASYLETNEDVEPFSVTEASSLRSGKGVIIRDLVKKFGSFTAVDNLSVTFLNDQVTVLLGPNGAGKTTVMNCMMGFTKKHSGTIKINGRTINPNNKMECRIGYCPQNNIVFDQLTVKQHLELFAGIRGLRGAALGRACDKALSHLRMHEKRDTWAMSLSGGQKRRLSIAMACIGGPDAIVLDEPTAGVDPFNRRLCWDVIQEYRPGHTVILTTHFMDEAEFLGDRIVIMSNGKCRVSGSSLFLKKRFSVGYTLDIELKKDENYKSEFSMKENDAAATRLLEAVKEHVPGSSILSVNFTGSIIQLPLEAGKHMVKLMRMLETDGISLGIADFSLGSSSLSVIFLRIAQQMNEEKMDHRTGSFSNNIYSAEMGGALEDNSLPDLPPTVPDSELQRVKFWAIYRFHYQRKYRDFSSLYVHILQPFILIFFAAVYWDGSNVYSLLALYLVFLMIYYSNYLLGVTANDQYRGYKARLMLSGVTPLTYWWGLILAEGTAVFGIVTCSIIALSMGDMPMFKTEAQITAAACFILYASSLLTLISCSCTAWVHLEEGVMVAFYVLLFVVFSCIPYIVVSTILLLFPTPGNALHTSAVAITWVFRFISPHFNCLMGLFHVCGVGAYASDPSDTNELFTTSNAWSATGGGALIDIVFISVDIAILTCLLYMKEMGSFKRRKVSTANIPWDADITELNPVDEDVLEEERLAMADKTSPLCFQRVRYMYKRGKFIAVRSVSFAVKRGECVGLLGVNGAGKTTVMNIAAGLLAPSEGKGLLGGINPIENSSIIAERLALNPQHDDIFPELTVYESIMLCAKLRGYAKGPALTAWMEKYIELNGLTEYANKKGRILSGGNKRKLNLAYALIGTRDVILLDEPAAGLDPVARHTMGGIIRQAGKNSAVLYTSHCMEQAESLCSRIAIMKSGRIKAIGSLSRLKQRFSQGLVLEARMSYVTRNEVYQRAEAHNISLSMTIPSFQPTIIRMLTKLQIKTPHRKILGTTFISNSMKTGERIATEDLISLVLAEEGKEALKLFVKEHFLDSSVVEVQASTMIFHLSTKGNYLISEAFEKMNSCPQSTRLEDFIIKYSSLDMVFASFAKTGTNAGNGDEYGLIS